MSNSVFVTDLPTNREKYLIFNSPISGGNFCEDMIELAEKVYLSGSSYHRFHQEGVKWRKLALPHFNLLSMESVLGPYDLPAVQ